MPSNIEEPAIATIVGTPKTIPGKIKFHASNGPRLFSGSSIGQNCKKTISAQTKIAKQMHSGTKVPSHRPRTYILGESGVASTMRSTRRSASAINGNPAVIAVRNGSSNPSSALSINAALNIEFIHACLPPAVTSPACTRTFPMTNANMRRTKSTVKMM